MNRKIKWGIAGLGKIAHKFASDLQRVEKAELIAVASTDWDRAKTFQNELNDIPKHLNIKFKEFRSITSAESRILLYSKNIL